MELNFTRAVVKLDFISQNVTLIESSDLGNADKHIWNSKLNTHNKNVAIKKFEPLNEEVRDFLEAVSTSSKPLVSGEDGAYNVRLAEWALSSMD